jgi:hypothetical protein
MSEQILDIIPATLNKTEQARAVAVFSRPSARHKRGALILYFDNGAGRVAQSVQMLKATREQAAAMAFNLLTGAAAVSLIGGGNLWRIEFKEDRT